MAEQVVHSQCHRAARNPPARCGSRLQDEPTPCEVNPGLRVEEGKGWWWWTPHGCWLEATHGRAASCCQLVVILLARPPSPGEEAITAPLVEHTAVLKHWRTSVWRHQSLRSCGVRVRLGSSACDSSEETASP